MKDLLQQYFDGELTEEKVADLRRWLSSDRTNIREFLREAQMHGHVHSIYALRHEPTASSQELEPARGTHQRASGSVAKRSNRLLRLGRTFSFFIRRHRMLALRSGAVALLLG